MLGRNEVRTGAVDGTFNSHAAIAYFVSRNIDMRPDAAVFESRGIL